MALFQNHTLEPKPATMGVVAGVQQKEAMLSISITRGGLVPTIGPDDYTEATTEELTEDDLATLSKIWPGGFRAAANLLLMLDDKEIGDDDPLLAMNLFDLVRGTFPEAEAAS